MKFKTNANPSYQDVKTKLHANFSDYQLKMRGKQFLVVKKSTTCGANVIIKKDSIAIYGNFPSMGAQIIFTLLLILLGFIIPLIIYFAVFHKKFKALEKEIGGFLEREYGDNL